MITLTTCKHCDGAARVANFWPLLPLNAEGTGFDPAALREGQEIVAEDVEILTCDDCNGIAVDTPEGRVTVSRYRDRFDTFGTPYASEASARAVRNRGKRLRRCKQCRGVGRVARVPYVNDCRHCAGTPGQEVTAFAPGDVMPEGFDLYRHVNREALAAYMSAVPVVVQRHPDSALTMGAALLGLGTIYTCGDYGRALGQDDATVIAGVREGLTSTQYVKLADKETRRIADEILISITRTGYTVTTRASVASGSRAALPPTYTADVLNQPY